MRLVNFNTNNKKFVVAPKEKKIFAGTILVLFYLSTLENVFFF
jgi:hypothetical protein